MLDGVVDQYLATVTEREFDAPLLALLHAEGFSSVHQLHGVFEFGKDFIAQRCDDSGLRQYALQSKAGDINLSGWRPIRSQIDEARLNGLAHPDFRRDLPRAAVLVLTGRLIGGAALDAQEYAARLVQQGEPGFDIWDREALRLLLTTHPECGLAGGSPGELLALLGAIDQGHADHRSVETYTRRWATASLRQVAIEAAIVANRLRTARRSDLAAITALALLRAALCQAAAPESQELAAAARHLHTAYATGLLNRHEHATDDPMELVKTIDPGFVHVTYPVTCLKLAETWGLLAIAPHADPATASRARTATSALLRHQPGAAHPISDRWAVSLIPAVLTLVRTDRTAAEVYLRNIVTWIADAYEHGLGLANTSAAPTDEVIALLGAELEHVTTPKANTSYLATVVIDLAAAADLGDTYDFAVNELLAAGARPTLVVADESQAKWGAADEGLELVPVVRYREPWTRDAVHSSHHRPEVGTEIAAWDALALSTLARNRHAWWAISHIQQGGSVR